MEPGGYSPGGRAAFHVGSPAAPPPLQQGMYGPQFPVPATRQGFHPGGIAAPLTVHTPHMRQSLETMYGTADIRQAYCKATAMDNQGEQEDEDFLPPGSDNPLDAQDSAADGDSTSDFVGELSPRRELPLQFPGVVPNVQLSVYAELPQMVIEQGGIQDGGAQGSLQGSLQAAYSPALGVYERYRPFEDAEALARLETVHRRKSGARLWKFLAPGAEGGACLSRNAARNAAGGAATPPTLFVSRGSAGAPVLTSDQLRALWTQIVYALASGKVRAELLRSRLRGLEGERVSLDRSVRSGPPEDGSREAMERWKRDSRCFWELERAIGVLEREIALLEDADEALWRIVEWKSELAAGEAGGECLGWPPLRGLLSRAAKPTVLSLQRSVGHERQNTPAPPSDSETAGFLGEPYTKRPGAAELIGQAGGSEGRAAWRGSQAEFQGEAFPPGDSSPFHRAIAMLDGGRPPSPLNHLPEPHFQYQEARDAPGPSQRQELGLQPLYSFFRSLRGEVARLRAGGQSAAVDALRRLGTPIPRAGGISYRSVSHPCEPLLGEYRLASLALQAGEDPSEVLCRAGRGDGRVEQILRLVRRPVGEKPGGAER